MITEVQGEVQAIIAEQSRMTAILFGVFGFVFVTLFTIVAFFVKGIINQGKSNADNVGRLFGKTNTIDGRVNTIERLYENKLDNFALQLNRLTESLNNHTLMTERRMEQKDKTNELLMELLKKVVSDGNNEG